MPSKQSPTPPPLRPRALVTALLSLILAGCGGGGGGALPPSDYFTSVAVADLDGDGLPDIAATFTHSSSAPPHPGFVAVFLQRRGQSGIFAAPVAFAVGNDPVAIAIGDLDGDRRADLAVANSGSLAGPCPPDCGSAGTGVTVQQQQALAGRLQPAQNYPAGVDGFVQSVAVADVDGDGRPDLVIAQSGAVFVRLQDSANRGQFAWALRVVR